MSNIIKLFSKFKRLLDSPDISSINYRFFACSGKSKDITDKTFTGMSGGEIIHQMMVMHDVKHIFGYPGGAILPVLDAIYKSKYLQFILARHEQGAGHMAEGYARATGKPGVVLVTSGPGATNLVTTMADALADGVPIVYFTGQVPTHAVGTDAFQEVDIIGISRICTKWNVMVTNVADLPHLINEAFKIATSGRPGPVLVDLPKNITAETLKYPIYNVYPLSTSNASEKTQPNEALSSRLKRVINLINTSKRPVIYAGHGIVGNRDGPKTLTDLANKGNMPVTTTLHALGSFDEKDSKSLHMLGMHGSCYANLAMQKADLIIALGARFDDRVTCNVSKFAPEAITAAEENRGGIVQFEISSKNINRVVQATEVIEGDVTRNLKKILPFIRSSPRKEWFDQINTWKENYPFYYDRATDNQAIKPQQVIEEIDRQTEHIKDRVVITTGVGQHQMWTAQFFRWRTPKQLITSGSQGTMGYGLPSAIGVKIAKPDHIVIDIDGDASFCMTAMELATAAEFNVGVKVLLLNNSIQGMVKQWQDFFHGRRYSGSIMKNPDFVKLAQAMGVEALRVTRVEDLKDKIKTFLEYNDGPIVLDAVVCKKEILLPMVPPGKALNEFLVHPYIDERNKNRVPIIY